MKGLVPDQLARLQPTQTDLLTHISWSSSGATIADLDLSCVLLDNRGRALEEIAFPLRDRNSTTRVSPLRSV